MYLAMVAFPVLTATWAQTVLTELVSAVVRSIEPKDSPPSLDSGTPEIVFGDEPSSTELGEYLPESMPATAVTVLKVDPGGYPGEPCVARLNVEPPCVGWLGS